MLTKLTPAVHDKVWGTPRTEPWLENPEGGKIGEIWYSDPSVMPVLVKFLFTSERLSVQVHPGDEYAQLRGHARGKTEMWHVLRAEPGATVALGLRDAVSKEAIRAAALDGTIVELLDWVPARKQDTFFIPAGTIHAIGEGLVLCEIQQYSDVTYRLYDYQRQPARPLHLEDSLAVAHLAPADCRQPAFDLKCQFFQTESLRVTGSAVCVPRQTPAMYVAIAGQGQIRGEAFHAGEAWLSRPGTESFTIEAEAADFVVVGGTEST